MPTVFIAGASGYLGRHLCREYHRRGWNVRALVRNTRKAQGIEADGLFEAEATQPQTLIGLMDGCDLVVSALGITRQADGLGYWEVDYQANLNLLREASRAGVPHFAYIHVLNADKMAHVPLVAAKSAFVTRLREADIQSTVIAPSGYFSDMGEILAMARSGHVWLFGNGALRLNPIHGADLAAATADAVAEGRAWLDIGGPDIFSQKELAQAAFSALGLRAHIHFLPDWLRRAAIALLPHVAPHRLRGPALFFLTALGLDMIGEPSGVHRLKTHFAMLAGRRSR
ncbi:short chain dehydrogenase [Pseudoruegeria aquimaris]|uniref:Short chain dehydrogenase n=1 Tax=Pseudoruegeria aquimaris TaxID=393663 RepID=A0A1Y5S3C9_9RHOB|nr:SDR family oxidoreductase [Pseudoruegeria aquimaris]SLN31418.1 short chain dehydrogenase [Pseudoruegeria aquimaris]